MILLILIFKICQWPTTILYKSKRKVNFWFQLQFHKLIILSISWILEAGKTGRLFFVWHVALPFFSFPNSCFGTFDLVNGSVSCPFWTVQCLWLLVAAQFWNLAIGICGVVVAPYRKLFESWLWKKIRRECMSAMWTLSKTFRYSSVKCLWDCWRQNQSHHFIRAWQFQIRIYYR